LAGYYPALILSSYKPITIINNKVWTSGKGVLLRKILVVFQFATSLALISGTFIVYSQISYMQEQELGVDLEHGLSIREPNGVGDTWVERSKVIETFHSQLKTIPGVVEVGSASNVPDGGKADIFAFSAGVKLDGDMEGDRSTYVLARNDANFMKVIGAEILAGRNFNKIGLSDSSTAILNESARKKLGFATNESILGQRFKLGTWPRQYTVVGVSRDFNRQTLKHGVEPTIYRSVWRGGGGYAVLKLQKNAEKSVVEAIRAKWQTDFPNAPFEYYFLDQQFDKAYKNDKQFGIFFGIFAGLAIFIACLGLFGLSSFIALQKTKEIGVRKVLGASLQGIVVLMYKNFLILVSIAVLIGLPIIYLIMESWLSNYTYRINMPLWVFAISALALFLISFITVALQSLKAANVNPVESLKYE
jgi:putative ABC transport system permease protein